MESVTQSISKNDNKSLLNDIYSSLYEIRNIIYKAKNERFSMDEYEQRLALLEEQLFSEINNKTNGNLAKLLINIDTLKNEVYIYYFNRSETSPVTNYKEDLKAQYTDTVNKIKENNDSVSHEYCSLSQHEKFSMFNKPFIPSRADILFIGIPLALALDIILPINSMKISTYSSQTHQLEEEYQENLYNYQTKHDMIIKLYTNLLNDKRGVIDYKLESYTSFDEAIIKAEEILNSFSNNNKDTNPYYEIISFDSENNSTVTAFFVALVTLILFVAGDFIEVLDNDGIFITRIIHSIKLNIMYKEDLKRLIEHAKKITEENAELANELYSLFIKSAKNDNFDLLFERIEKLKNEPEEYVSLAKRR